MTEGVDRAIRLLREAARARPDDPEIRVNLMVAWSRKNRPAELAGEFFALVTSRPDWTQLHYDVIERLVRALGLGEHVRRAFEIGVREAGGTDPHVAYYALGLAYAALDRQDEAIRAYQEAIRLRPDYAPAYHNLALAYHFSGRTDEAMAACRLAAQKNRTLAEPHYFLGVAYMNRDQPKLALAHFVEFMKLAKPYLRNYVPQAQLSVRILKERLSRGP